LTDGNVGGVIEIRPLTPPGRRPTRALAAVLRKSFLQADPHAGTLLIAEAPALTWRPAREWRLWLPATGRPDAVTTICLATYTRRINMWNYPQWRMLLLDHDGQALATSRARDQRQGMSMWPASLFTPLRRVGISATEERFANAAELNHVHPDVQSEFAG
jgi:hypothetical protein